MIDLVTALPAVKVAVDLLKETYEYVKKNDLNDPRLLELMTEIRSKILDAQQNEIELQERVRKLESQLELKKMRFDNDMGAYYDESEDEERVHYCPKCKDGEQKLCRLYEYNDGEFQCRVCGLVYRTKEVTAIIAEEAEKAREANRPKKRSSLGWSADRW